MKSRIAASSFIIPFILLNISTTHSQNIGEVTVKKWSKDKASAFSFSFDDSFTSHYLHARPVLNQYNFKGTFYLSTGILDDSNHGDDFGTWDNFREMAGEGHEMGAHTVSHYHLPQLNTGNKNTPGTIHYELYQSKLRIEEEIGQQCITFAYPFAEHNTTVETITKIYFDAARIDGASPNPSSPTYNQFFRLTSAEMLFNLPRNSIQSDSDELEQMKGLVNSTISQGKWLTFFGHEVVPFSQLHTYIQNGAWYPMTKEWLNDVSLWLKSKSDNGDVWVETIANVTRYINERNGFTSQVVSATGNELNILVTDQLPDETYNYPLTVDITVPDSWIDVEFAQSERTETLISFISDGKRVVRAEVIPDGGTVNLSIEPANNLFTINGKIKYNNNVQTNVGNVAVSLKDQAGLEVLSSTDTSGNFYFNELTPGNYQLSFSKADGWGGVNATDALEALRYFAGLTTLDSLQIKSADVNNSVNINATDALLILSRYAGIINSFEINDWIFNEPIINVVITDTNIELEIKTIAAGDVNKSFIP